MDEDKITIDIGEIDLSSLSDINMSTINITGTPTISTYSYTSATPSYTFNTGAGSNGSWLSAGTSGPTWTTSSADLEVKGDAQFNGDIKWQGRSLGKVLETIESRLAILTPDPEKLEHFEALKKAYDHYKTLEALCEVPKKEKDGS